MDRPRRTKIIATYGPACASDEALGELISQGVDLIRFNMSHGPDLEAIARVRAFAAENNRAVGVLIDLQGPKIRISKFAGGEVALRVGDRFILDATHPKDAGTHEIVGIDYPDLAGDLAIGDELLLADGIIALRVTGLDGSRIETEVLIGGLLQNNKGINLRGGGLSASAFTDKDLADIEATVATQPDYYAMSFVKDATDIETLRGRLDRLNSASRVIAKIERIEAIDNLDNIIEASDGVMVARGDLGVEMGVAEVPALQKRIISKARELNTAVITATQMMESMITQPIPTRAEVSDVVNAILDGTDAVMLSAETAVGSDPVRVIKAVHDACMAGERHRISRRSRHRVESRFTRADESIAMAAMYVANHIDLKAIIALTESGSTPLWMSRIRSGIPIFGLSRHASARGRMTLFRGVYPMEFDVTRCKLWEVSKEAIETLRRAGFVAEGDLVAVTKGDTMGVDGGTNSLKILTVNNHTR